MQNKKTASKKKLALKKEILQQLVDVTHIKGGAYPPTHPRHCPTMDY